MCPAKKKTSSDRVADDAPFEQVMQGLEALVQNLEGGELGLEDSLQAFEDGVALARRAQAALDAMEKRIDVLTAEGSLQPLLQGEDDAS